MPMRHKKDHGKLNHSHCTSLMHLTLTKIAFTMTNFVSNWGYDRFPVAEFCSWRQHSYDSNTETVENIHIPWQLKEIPIALIFTHDSSTGFAVYNRHIVSGYVPQKCAFWWAFCVFFNQMQFKPRLEHIILPSLSWCTNTHKYTRALTKTHLDIFMNWTSLNTSMHSTYSKHLSCNNCTYNQRAHFESVMLDESISHFHFSHFSPQFSYVVNDSPHDTWAAPCHQQDGFILLAVKDLLRRALWGGSQDGTSVASCLCEATKQPLGASLTVTIVKHIFKNSGPINWEFPFGI